MNEQLKNHVVMSLTSKKIVTVLYSLTWLFAILLIVILKSATPSETIVNALLLAISGVFTAFAGANVLGDHNGKPTTTNVQSLSTPAPQQQEAKPSDTATTVKPAGGN